MKLIVTPGKPLIGTATVPGDKSLSHRAVLFAALAEGESHIRNFLVSGVTHAMLNALTELGVNWRLEGDTLTVHGRGLRGLRTPAQPLDCGNSATTIRFLAGALAAAGVPAVLDGSAGLRRRPMERIVEPLREMGVAIEASATGTAPLVLGGRGHGETLRGLHADLPVASAQVKTCLLLAALAADGPTVLREPGPSRDHTERMLRSMGVEVDGRMIESPDGPVYETRVEPLSAPLLPIEMTLPGDMSAAAFLLVAGTITPGSEIRVPGVEINPTRTGLVDALRAMGADIQIESRGSQAGEPVGDISVRASALRGGDVRGPLVVRMIDEFSVFGAAAVFATGQTTVREAAELRYKESDRIHTLVTELTALGVQAEALEDGFSIQGGQLGAGQVQAHGDHRLAMALAVAGLAGDGPVTIEGAEIIQESFPAFAETLRALGADLAVLDEQPV